MEYSAYFWLKKVVATFSSPLLIWLFLSVALIIHFRNRAVLKYAFCSLLLFVVLSSPLTTHFMLAPLEKQYDPHVFVEKKELEGIVVLGCGHAENEKLPASSLYGTCSLKRVVHGVILHNETGLPLYFSGGIMPTKSVSEADNNAALAISLGVKESSLYRVNGAYDTETESKTLKAALQNKHVYLVTSASHMERASKFLNRAGIKTVSSPTDHLVTEKEVSLSAIGSYLPSVHGLERSSYAIYEYLGLIEQYLNEK